VFASSLFLFSLHQFRQIPGAHSRPPLFNNFNSLAAHILSILGGAFARSESGSPPVNLSSSLEIPDFDSCFTRPTSPISPHTLRCPLVPSSPLQHNGLFSVRKWRTADNVKKRLLLRKTSVCFALYSVQMGHHRSHIGIHSPPAIRRMLPSRWVGFFFFRKIGT
jgi:hypothetical protein